MTKFGKYSFIAVDACPIPGPKRPFNFFGNLDDVSTYVESSLWTFKEIIHKLTSVVACHDLNLIGLSDHV